MSTPKLVVTVADGRSVFTKVTLDGAILPATRVMFDSGEGFDGYVRVRVEFYADLTLNVEGQKLVLVSDESGREQG